MATATQQLPTSLPPGWESDYDGVSQRWFFVHRPSGFNQYVFPKAGDEISRAAALAQPRPTNGTSVTSKMEAMVISEDRNQNKSTTPVNQQASPSPTSPQSVSRKPLPQRQSTQSPPQPSQQYQQVFTSQSTTNTQVMQNVQQVQQVQQFQQVQQPVQTQQYSQIQQQQQFQQGQPIQVVLQQNPTQQAQRTQQPQQYQQVLQPQQVQYGQFGPGQPQHTPQPQQTQQFQQTQQPQNPQYQQIQQTQQFQQQAISPQVQSQYATTSVQVTTTHPNATQVVGQRRFSTIPVLHPSAMVQANNYSQQPQQPVLSTRHASIGTPTPQPQPQYQSPIQNHQVPIPQRQIANHQQNPTQVPLSGGFVPLTVNAQNTPITSTPLQSVKTGSTAQLPASSSPPPQYTPNDVPNASNEPGKPAVANQTPPVPGSTAAQISVLSQQPQPMLLQGPSQPLIQQVSMQNIPSNPSMQIQNPQQLMQTNQQVQAIAPNQAPMQTQPQISNVLVQGQQVQQQYLVQSGPAGQGHPTYATQVVQQNIVGSPQVQSPPSVQYVQQGNVVNIQNPPPPGMQYVQVGIPPNCTIQLQPIPGMQVQAQAGQTVQQPFNPNTSPQYAVQLQQFQGGASATTTMARPGLLTRISSSTLKGSKKAYEASKGYIKSHPGQSIAIAGSVGIIAEACGVNVLSDAVAGSKVYANVQNAKHKRKSLAVQKVIQAPAQHTTPNTTQVNHSLPIGQVNGAPIQQMVQHVPLAVHHIPQNQGNHATYIQNQVAGNIISHPIGQGGGFNNQQFSQPHQLHYQQHHQHPQPTLQQNSLQQLAPQQNSTQQASNQQTQSTLQQNSLQQSGPQQNPPQQTSNQQENSLQQFAFPQNSPQQASNQQPQDSLQQNIVQQFAPQQNSPQQAVNQQPYQYIDQSGNLVTVQNPQQMYTVQQNSPVQYYQLQNTPQQPQQIFIQDSSGQYNQQQDSSNLGNYAMAAYNHLPFGQTNSPSQSQSPSNSTTDNQSSSQQQNSTPSTSPFDPSSQQQFSPPSPSAFDPSQQQQFTDPSTSTFNPSTQQTFTSSSPLSFDPSSLQQPQSPGPSSTTFDLSNQQTFASSTPLPFDPSSLQQSQSPDPSSSIFDPAAQQTFNSCIPTFDPTSQQQLLQDQTSNTMAQLAMNNSQQFSTDLMAQSICNESMLNDNSYTDGTTLNPATPDQSSFTDVAVGQETDFEDQQAAEFAALSEAEDDEDAAIF